MAAQAQAPQAGQNRTPASCNHRGGSRSKRLGAPGYGPPDLARKRATPAGR